MSHIRSTRHPEDGAGFVQVELTARIAEMAGLPHRELEVPCASSLDELLGHVEATFSNGAGQLLLADGRLHPSVLVIVDDRPVPHGENSPLSGTERIQLLLPVAGG